MLFPQRKKFRFRQPDVFRMSGLIFFFFFFWLLSAQDSYWSSGLYIGREEGRKCAKSKVDTCGIYSAFLEIPPNKFTYTFLSINIITWLPMSAQESEKCFIGGNFAENQQNQYSVKYEEKSSYLRCYWQILSNLKTQSLSSSEIRG